jgi:hypothetical protein
MARASFHRLPWVGKVPKLAALISRPMKKSPAV